MKLTQFTSIRVTLTAVAVVVIAAIAYGVGASLPLAVVIGLVLGFVVVAALFTTGPLARAADRAEDSLNTPR